MDSCLEKVAEKALSLGYEVIVIADHGNADTMKNEDGSPHTQHTLNPVPCIWMSAEMADRELIPGDLTDIAPTILSRMGITKPESMTGKVLVN